MDHRAAWPVVRRTDSESLHRQALRLRRLRIDQGITDGQERLWDQIVAELVWRSARRRRAFRRCWCDLCSSDVFDLVTGLEDQVEDVV